MKTSIYERLTDNENHFVGFKRTTTKTITEYLPAGGNVWQLESFAHDETKTARIMKPPTNIVSMKRKGIREK